MNEKITLQDILEVYDIEMEEMDSYYHLPSQSMIVLSKDDMEIAENNIDTKDLEDWKKESVNQAKDFIKNKDNYITFPSKEEYNEYGIMEEFIKQNKNSSLLDKLKVNLSGEEAFRKFKDTLYDVSLQDEWYEFRDEKCLEVAKLWCEKNKVEYEK
ncbi:MAG: UPF0158 family protein [Clostridium sp.]